MDVYLIAPLPTFDRDVLVSDKVVNVDERYALMAAAGIATVAAYFDDDFGLRLCDESIHDVDFGDPAEVVCISMNVAQAARGIQIARRFRALGRIVVMGGAHVSLAPEAFDGEADCLVIGEFEPVAETFIADLRAGRLQPQYRAGKADLGQSRPPRWDLYPNDRAVSGVVQTSRGCPFDCHFCDVIQYLGRQQRHKPVAAVIAELQALYDHGYRSVQLSDDNFTVYRRRTRELLAALAAWNGRDGRDPLQFITQASIDLSRDAALMEMCAQAGVRDIFFGIETSNEDALKESRKRQNLRQDLVLEVEKLTRAGIVVTAGLMVGFDHDELDCFERQFRFGMALPVVNLRVSVLVAPVATPLHAQMKAQGRLLDGDMAEPYAGGDLWTNIVPRNMSRRELADGATWLVHALAAPDNAIQRFQRMAALLGPAPEHLRRPVPRRPGRSGADAMLKLMRRGLRDAGGRRVIEAVSALIRARPEIERDLTSALANFLNTHLALQNGAHRPPASSPRTPGASEHAWAV